MRNQKKIKHLITASTLCLAVILSATNGVWAQSGKKKVVVNEANNRETIKICVGDRLDVRLPAQLGTGFGWHVIAAKEKRLKLLGAPDTEKATKQKVGGYEIQVFHFAAVARGRVKLVLGYKRALENDKVPAKYFRLTVRIC